MDLRAEHFEKKSARHFEPYDRMSSLDVAGVLYSMRAEHEKAAECFRRAASIALAESKLASPPSNTIAQYGQLERLAKQYHRQTKKWPSALPLGLVSALEKCSGEVSKEIAKITKHDAVGGQYKRYFKAPKKGVLSLKTLGKSHRKKPLWHETIFEIGPNAHQAVFMYEVKRVASKITERELREELKRMRRLDSQALSNAPFENEFLENLSITPSEAVKKFGERARAHMAAYRVTEAEETAKATGARQCVKKLSKKLGEEERESLLNFLAALPYAHAAYHHYSP